MAEPCKQSTSVVASWFSNGPWRSRTVMVALLVTLVGLFFWMGDARDGATSGGDLPESANEPAAPHNDPPDSGWDWNTPLPGYAKFSASYMLGCFVGWFFRRVTRLIFFIGAIAIALLAMGQFVGLETGTAQDEVKRGSERAKGTMDTAKQWLEFGVPSAAGFGIGMFMGFRRRRIRVAHEAIA